KRPPAPANNRLVAPTANHSERASVYAGSLQNRHMPPAYLGEFEHLLLLTVLRLGSAAHGVDIARELEERAGRRVSRGALYTSLDRLETKGLLRWKLVAGTPARDGIARRLYTVTP